MPKKKITRKDRERLYGRVISRGENKGHSTGSVIGHAFAKGGGYLAGKDIVTLSSGKSFEELIKMGLIEKYDTLSVLPKWQREKMTKAELKAFNRENTVYIASSRLVKLYKDKTDKKALFSRGGSVAHALIQKEVYMSFDRATRMSFLNEKELERLYNEKRQALLDQSRDRELSQNDRLIALSRLDKVNELRNEGKIQLVDFAYVENGQMIFGEAVTANYSSDDVNSKYEFVSVMTDGQGTLNLYD